MKKIFYNKTIKITINQFKKFDKEKLLNLILKGNIVIIKRAVDQKNFYKYASK